MRDFSIICYIFVGSIYFISRYIGYTCCVFRVNFVVYVWILIVVLGVRVQNFVRVLYYLIGVIFFCYYGARSLGCFIVIFFVIGRSRFYDCEGRRFFVLVNVGERVDIILNYLCVAFQVFFGDGCNFCGNFFIQSAAFIKVCVIFYKICVIIFSSVFNEVYIIRVIGLGIV